MDTDRLPGALLKAYYEADLAALSRDDPSGFASAKQKREAKESARDRLEAEAKDGRFKRRKCTPVHVGGRGGPEQLLIMLKRRADRPDVLNLWRGFSVESCQGGSWAMLRDHILTILARFKGKAGECRLLTAATRAAADVAGADEAVIAIVNVDLAADDAFFRGDLQR